MVVVEEEEEWVVVEEEVVVVVVVVVVAVVVVAVDADTLFDLDLISTQALRNEGKNNGQNSEDNFKPLGRSIAAHVSSTSWRVSEVFGKPSVDSKNCCMMYDRQKRTKRERQREKII